MMSKDLEVARSSMKSHAASLQLILYTPGVRKTLRRKLNSTNAQIGDMQHELRKAVLAPSTLDMTAHSQYL